MIIFQHIMRIKFSRKNGNERNCDFIAIVSFLTISRRDALARLPGIQTVSPQTTAAVGLSRIPPITTHDKIKFILSCNDVSNHCRVYITD